MKIKNIIVIFLILGSIGIAPASAESSLSDWFNSLFGSSPSLDLYADPGGTIQATPGQTIIFDLRYYNPYPTAMWFDTELWKMTCGADDGFYIGKAGATSVMPSSSGYDQIAMTAPTQAGTFSYSLISYYGPSIPAENFDDEVCTTVIVSEPYTPDPDLTWPTPTATPTPTSTIPSNIPPTAKITYSDMGNGKIVLMGTQSTDADGIIESYSWYINNEYVNGQSTFTHVFDKEGFYVVKLIVEDDKSATAEAVLNVPVTKNDAGQIDTGNIDESAAISTPPTEGRTGIWIEDGALKVPGFQAVFAGLVLLFFLKRKSEKIHLN